MSCWVVPMVAAEIWGISLTEVLQRIQAGDVVSKMEYGFLLVDTAPLGPLFRSTAADGRAKPPTWVAIQTWVEREEIEDDDEDESDVRREMIEAAAFPADLPIPVAPGSGPCSRDELGESRESRETLDDAGVDLDVDGDSIEEEPDDGMALGWRERRAAAGRMRKPPGPA